MEKGTNRKRQWKRILFVLALLVLVRLSLPFFILHYANKKLSALPGYYGHVEDIDLALFRGAYNFDNIFINKVDTVSQSQTPFFSAVNIDLSVEWKALLHGSIVGELVFKDPTLQFTKDKVEPAHVRKDSSSFKKLLNNFMPLRVNRFEINNGNLRYIDEHSKPPVDVSMTDLHVLALNLRNSYDSTVLLPASVTAIGNLYGGNFNFNLKLNPLADKPTFDLNAEVKNTDLVKLNDFFQAYAKVDVNKGKFSLYTEVASRDGKFDGYVKPLIEDLDVLGKEDQHDSVFRKLWEGLVGATAEIFKNQSKDRLATKIPLEGSLNDPKTDILTALANILQNAFIHAIQPAIDHEISIASVGKEEPKKTFLQKIFGKK